MKPSNVSESVATVLKAADGEDWLEEDNLT